MKFKILLLLVSILLTSCIATQKYANTTSKVNWNKTPDLTNITYKGGDGKSMENCIVIKNAENEMNGVASEYAFISKKHGIKFIDWKPIQQSCNSKAKKTFDILVIQTLPGNEKITYYFDITDFYGKF
jgi:hypothetical protein